MGLQNLAGLPLFSMLLGPPLLFSVFDSENHPLSRTQKSPLTSQQQGKSCSWFPKCEKVGALVSHSLTSGPSVSSRPVLRTLYLPFVFLEAQSSKGIKMAGSALQTKYVTSLILAV